MAKFGWFLLDRSIQDSWLWKDKPFNKSMAWIDLIMLANWEDKKMPYKGKVITCKRGDVNLSISELAKRWGWDRKTAKRFLKLLESDNMITLNATTHRTTVTIVNYDKYQHKGSTNSTAKSQQSGQQSPSKVDITKEYKRNKKEIKEKDLPPASDSDDEDEGGWMTPEEAYRVWKEQQKNE